MLLKCGYGCLATQKKKKKTTQKIRGQTPNFGPLGYVSRYIHFFFFYKYEYEDEHCSTIVKGHPLASKPLWIIIFALAKKKFIQKLSTKIKSIKSKGCSIQNKSESILKNFTKSNIIR